MNPSIPNILLHFFPLTKLSDKGKEKRCIPLWFLKYHPSERTILPILRGIPDRMQDNIQARKSVTMVIWVNDVTWLQMMFSQSLACVVKSFIKISLLVMAKGIAFTWHKMFVIQVPSLCTLAWTYSMSTSGNPYTLLIFSSPKFTCLLRIIITRFVRETLWRLT